MFCRPCFPKVVLILLVLAVAFALPAASFGSSWALLRIPGQPAARMDPAMAWDPVSGKTVLFGGVGTVYPQGTVYYNDTWTFDGKSWSQVPTTVAPPARAAGAMGYDARTKKLVLFGGFNAFTSSGYLQDTWVWDGTTSTWKQATMNTPPPPATGALVFTDPVSRRAIMFGGYNATQKIPSDSVTWRWTGKGWQKLNPTHVPPGRGWGFAANDPVHKNVVLGGGSGATLTNDTWTWDGSDWAQQFPATQIDALANSAAMWDPDMQVVVLFGGFDLPLGKPLNQTWSWDGSNWAQLNPPNAPRARDSMGMSYDPVNHEIVMFGGELVKGSLLRETWTFTGN